MRARQDEDNDDALDRPSIDTCGWDPGRQNGLHLLILHPTLLRRDATTTELNIRGPLPPLNTSASMRARQDEDNDDAPARPSIDTCGWDPRKDETTARSAGVDRRRRRARQRCRPGVDDDGHDNDADQG